MNKYKRKFSLIIFKKISERSNPSILRSWTVKMFDFTFKPSLFHPSDKPFLHMRVTHHLTTSAVFFQDSLNIFIELRSSEDIRRTLLIPLIRTINDNSIIEVIGLLFHKNWSIYVINDQSPRLQIFV